MEVVVAASSGRTWSPDGALCPPKQARATSPYCCMAYASLEGMRRAISTGNAGAEAKRRNAIFQHVDMNDEASLSTDHATRSSLGIRLQHTLQARLHISGVRWYRLSQRPEQQLPVDGAVQGTSPFSPTAKTLIVSAHCTNHCRTCVMHSPSTGRVPTLRRHSSGETTQRTYDCSLRD